MGLMSDRVTDVVADERRGSREHQFSRPQLATQSAGNVDFPFAEPYRLHSPAGERWYVVHTQPHREFRAENQLGTQGFRTFLPRYRKTVRHARKLMTVNAPFFNRYLFIALDLSRDQWRSVNGTIGVTSLITHGMLPAAVPEGVVESLISISDADGFVNPSDGLQLGEQVRILTGPFAEKVGELVRFDGARRVRVLLELLGGVVAVSIERGHLMSSRAA
jgi:transcription elongation factor/antiterminator RfaH